MGDAAPTAHLSIGSGTWLALEDAIQTGALQGRQTRHPVTVDDAVDIARLLKAAGCDVIEVSLGRTPRAARPTLRAKELAKERAKVEIEATARVPDRSKSTPISLQYAGNLKQFSTGGKELSSSQGLCRSARPGPIGPPKLPDRPPPTKLSTARRGWAGGKLALENRS